MSIKSFRKTKKMPDSITIVKCLRKIRQVKNFTKKRKSYRM